MTVIPINVEGKERTLYMDNKLYNQLETVVKPNIHKKDKDGVYIVDGEEGSGKSVFALQIAKVLDPEFSLDRECFSAEEFVKAIVKSKKGQCVIYDEAFTGLSSRGSLSEINRLLVSLMMEMRQKNLFVIIVMPTFFLLDKYVALWRAKGLFHVYTKRGKRGRWCFFNKKKKKLLYLQGKKLYSYNIPRTSFRGRFYDQYTINEQGYRKKKGNALQNKSRVTRAKEYMNQRNTLFWILKRELKLTQVQTAEYCKKWGYSIDRSTISDALASKQKEFMEKSLIKRIKEEAYNELIEEETEKQSKKQNVGSKPSKTGQKQGTSP